MITCGKSYFPLTHFNLTPGQSCTLPTLTRTILCSCKLCPIPGIYATISLPFDSRTNTHFLLAELGFFGFLISVFRTTPFANGLPFRGFLDGRFFMWGPVRCIWFKEASRAIKNITIEADYRQVTVSETKFERDPVVDSGQRIQQQKRQLHNRMSNHGILHKEIEKGSWEGLYLELGNGWPHATVTFTIYKLLNKFG